jgi:hypothetical protein
VPDRLDVRVQQPESTLADEAPYRKGTVAMYIGGGIALIVIGAILAFAVTDRSIGALDIEAIGWICMFGGVLAIVLSLMMTRPRFGGARRTEIVERRDPEEIMPPTREVYERRDVGPY